MDIARQITDSQETENVKEQTTKTLKDKTNYRKTERQREGKYK